MGNKGYTITKHGGLRSGLMFYADGNTRDGMVDMVSGAPGLIVGAGGSMVVDAQTRAWAFAQGDFADAGLYFDTPVLPHFGPFEALSIWISGRAGDTVYWGGVQISNGIGQYPAGFGVLGEELLTLVMRQNGAQVARNISHMFEPNADQQLLVTWKKGGDTRFYKNGVLLGVDATPNTAVIDEVSGAVGIGQRNSLEPWEIPNALTRGAAVWNRELRPDEVLRLANDPLVLRRLCWRKRITNC